MGLERLPILPRHITATPQFAVERRRQRKLLLSIHAPRLDPNRMPSLSSPESIAAFIGAAAWLPQIATWLYKRYAVPLVRILPERQVEIGFTTVGPIFNIRIAFSAESKDAILDNLSVELRHEGGEVHTFAWMGYSETFSEITDTTGNRQTVARDQAAIALKLSTILLTEKFVRFQEPTYHEAHQPALSTVLKQYHYLKTQAPERRHTIIESREAFDLFEFYKGNFWWKPGEYSAQFRIGPPNRAKLRDASFSFRLSQSDIDDLRSNLEVIRQYYLNIVEADIAAKEAQRVAWVWRTVPFSPLKALDNRLDQLLGGSRAAAVRITSTRT